MRKVKLNLAADERAVILPEDNWKHIIEVFRQLGRQYPPGAKERSDWEYLATYVWDQITESTDDNGWS